MITPTLNNLEFSKNFPTLRCTGYAQPVAVQLSVAGVQVLDEQYMNDAAGGFDLRLKNLLHSLLKVQLPSSQISLQEDSLVYIQLTIATDVFNCYVAKGGVNYSQFPIAANYALNFCKYNFLTWQPLQKQVPDLSNQYLTYYSSLNCALKYRVLPADQTGTMDSPAAWEVNTYDLQELIGMGSISLEGATQVDVWAELPGGVQSKVQSFVFRQLISETEDRFVFENSLGGWDTVIFTGDLSEVDSHEVNRALIDEQEQEYDITYTRTFKKDSGYIPTEAERLWLREFFTSINRYHVTPDGLKRILVKSFENETRKGELNAFSFTFTYSKDDGTISIPR